MIPSPPLRLAIAPTRTYPLCFRSVRISIPWPRQRRIRIKTITRWCGHGREPSACGDLCLALLGRRHARQRTGDRRWERASVYELHGAGLRLYLPERRPGQQYAGFSTGFRFQGAGIAFHANQVLRARVRLARRCPTRHAVLPECARRAGTAQHVPATQTGDDNWAIPDRIPRRVGKGLVIIRAG